MLDPAKIEQFHAEQVAQLQQQQAWREHMQQQHLSGQVQPPALQELAQDMQQAFAAAAAAEAAATPERPSKRRCRQSQRLQQQQQDQLRQQRELLRQQQELQQLNTSMQQNATQQTKTKRTTTQVAQLANPLVPPLDSKSLIYLAIKMCIIGRKRSFAADFVLSGVLHL